MIRLIFFTLSTLFIGCYGKPPTERGKQLLQRIETEKLKVGEYPATIEGNLTDGGKTTIETNDFFYIVDTTKTSFTLKVFTENGLSDIYYSKTKQWVRTDK
jgi:hypothetical protein